jgi:hypothetical protein
MLYRDSGWLLLRVVKLHYNSAVRNYLSLLIYQLVILFKILRHEDWDNIRITTVVELRSGKKEGPEVGADAYSFG